MSHPDPAVTAPVGVVARLLAAATAAYAAVLVWATHHPKPRDLLGSNPPSDKLLHVTAYALLGGLVAATLFAAGRLTPRRVAAAAAGLAVFAVVDEATQPLPWFGRTADPLDWAFDAVGIALGIGAVAAASAIGRRMRAAR